MEDTSNYVERIDVKVQDTSNYVERIEGALSDRIGLPTDLEAFRAVPSGVYVPIAELEASVVAIEESIGVIEGQLEALGAAEWMDTGKDWFSSFFGIGQETAKAVTAFGAVSALSGELILTNQLT